MRADPRLTQKRATARRKARQAYAYAKYRAAFPRIKAPSFDYLSQPMKQFVVEKFGGDYGKR